MKQITTKLSHFFDQWRKLLTQPQWYWRVSFGSSRQILGFFITSGFILGLSSYIYFVVKTVPLWQNNFHTSISQLETNYPDNLKIAWDGQRLTNNLVNPLVIPYPSYISPDQFGWPQSLATLLPTQVSSASAQLVAAATASPSSLLTVSDTKITITQQDQGNDVALTDTPGFETQFSITKNSLPQFIAQANNRVQSYINTGEKVGVLLIPVWLILNLIWESIVPTFLIWLFFRFYHWPYKWSVAWHLVLMISLVAELVQQIGTWLYPTTNVPLFYLTLWILTALVLFNAPRHFSIVTKDS